MTIPDAFYLAGLLLSGIAIIDAHGRSLVGWAVLLVCVGLLWHIVR